MKTKQITLVGAGLAGCLLAIYLARRGFDVRLFESRPDLRSHDISAGRSINLSLSERGIHALKDAGLFSQVQKHLTAMPGRMLHSEEGTLQFQDYGRNDSDVHYSVSRAVLNKILLNEAEHSGHVSLFFDLACTGLNLQSRQLTFRNQITQELKRVDFDVVIGTDGAGSTLCNSMVDTNTVVCQRDMLAHGYKELVIPASSKGEFQIEKNALHIWPRGGFMLIALPNTDGSFTATLFLPHAGADSFDTLVDEKSILNFFYRHYPDAIALMPNLVSDFINHPVGSLGTVKCFPWHKDGRVLLLGDAAHAIVPFHGQGMNCAFEDCYELNLCLDLHDDWESLFNDLEQKRKPNADAIADMALENYIEMRDSVRNRKFHLHKEIEWLLEERYPDRFIPRYSMVMFHRIPYAEVQKRGVVQMSILNQLSAHADTIRQIDMALAEQLVNDKLTPF